MRKKKTDRYIEKNIGQNINRELLYKIPWVLKRSQKSKNKYNLFNIELDTDLCLNQIYTPLNEQCIFNKNKEYKTNEMSKKETFLDSYQTFLNSYLKDDKKLLKNETKIEKCIRKPRLKKIKENSVRKTCVSILPKISINKKVAYSEITQHPFNSVYYRNRLRRENNKRNKLNNVQNTIENGCDNTNINSKSINFPINENNVFKDKVMSKRVNKNDIVSEIQNNISYCSLSRRTMFFKPGLPKEKLLKTPRIVDVNSKSLYKKLKFIKIE